MTKKKAKKQPKYMVVMGEDLDFQFHDKIEDISELFNAHDLDTLSSFTSMDGVDHKDVNVAVGDCSSMLGLVFEIKDGKIVPVKLDMEVVVKFTQDYNSD